MPVVDASVVIDWVAPGVPPTARVQVEMRQLARERAELIAPRLMLEDVANALLTGLRRQRWSGAAADAAFRALQRLPVRLVDHTAVLARAWDLSRRYDNHPIYDMLYVALAERERTTLYSSDPALRERLATFRWTVTP